MEIILLERVEKLGQMGDVVRVKDGYARNYLLPHRKALRATRSNRERFEKERAQLEVTNLARRQDAEAVAKKMEGLRVTLLRQASESTQLYGSVNARDIADAVTAGGFTVDRRQVQLNVPIKSLGIHQVRVALHPEVFVTVSVNVARSEAEAEVQASGGKVAAEEFFEEGAAPQEGPDEAAETEAEEA
jgi:large subunit ribosomal protein L9